MASGERIAAVLLGATGLVGRELLGLLLRDDRVARVAVLGRRRTGLGHPKLAEELVDFDAPATWSDQVRGDVLFSALGTTLRAAGSRAAQARVDHDYQLRAAEAARRNGVRTCVIVSSSGASPRSRVFYSRMKGELERDVEALGIERTRFLRPSFLDGKRPESRPFEGWGLRVARALAPVLPAAARPIRVELVARAALEAAFDPAPGVARYEGQTLFDLARRGRA